MSNSPLLETTESLGMVSSVAKNGHKELVIRPASFRRRLRRWLWHILARQFTLLCVMAVRIAGWVGRRRPVDRKGCEIMLTGRFDSDNWILAHLGPLSASKKCSRVWMVSTNPVPILPKVVAIYPPRWLMKVVGVTQARLLTFVWAATRKRPHIVGGFHIMVNGIVAIILGRLVGARSMYLCVGGPAEICDGGIHGVETVFVKMETADAIVESRLLWIVAESDIVITMGTRAVSFFRGKGIDTEFHVVSGGIDPIRFRPAEDPPSHDLIFTGRLAAVKRIDILLQAVKDIANKIPSVKLLIIGEGNLHGDLRQLARDLDIDHHVSFAGYLADDDIVTWLRKSKVFVLTSDSEGLSLAMMEAMMCGLPAVVSDVGDLRDLVEDGVNGYLVPRRSPELFAARIIELLTDARRLEAFSKAARYSALRYTTEAATAKWDNIIEHYRIS